MTNAFKKAFTGAVAVLTIVWSMGISALVAPMQVSAASEGDVIKGTTLSTVYYYGTDGSRYAFPNEKTYFSWYTDFSEVETISDSALAAIPLAGNIVYRPGSRWIKIQSDPKTYAVTPEGTIRWVETEEVAEGLAGSDWNAFIDDVSDTFFVDYTVGTSLMSADDAYEGALVLDDTEIYMVWEGEKLLVSDAGMTSNNLQSRFVLDGSGVDLTSMTAGTSLTSENTAMTNTAQLGATSVTTGGLSVSLASDTAASATVPALANAVSFATYKLTATDGDVEVSQLVAKMNGLAAIDNLDAVYLYNGDTRLTNSRNVNSSTRSVTFGSLDLTIADGESEYVTVRADMADEDTVDSGSTAYFSLESEDSVTSDADVSGSFPVSGHSMTFSTTEVGTLTVEKTGTMSDVTLGEDESTIGKFKFTVDNVEAASLEAVTFNVDQASDHSNFQLYKSSTLLATGDVSDDLVTFVLSTPLEIEKSGDETLTLKADIGGQSGDEVTTYIEETSDVMAVGGTYGFNLDIDITDVDNNDVADGDTEVTTVAIEGGDLTFAFNGPSSTDVPIDSDQQDLLDFTVTSGNWTELQEIPVILTATSNGGDTNADLIDDSDDANYLNVSIRETDGSVWMGPLDLDTSDDDDVQTLTFDDYQNLEAGESIDLMVTVDIADNDDMEDATIKAALDMGNVVAEDVNGDTVTDIVPSANITGYAMTLTTSSVTVTVASTPSSGTFVKGTSDVSVVGYSFAAGENSDMTVSEVTFTAVGDDDGTITGNNNENDIDAITDHISTCSVYDSSTGTLVDGPESFENLGSEATPENQLVFTNTDWTVAAGETSKLLLKCTLSNNALESDSNDAYNFMIADHEDILITNENGESVDATVTTEYTVDGDTDVTGLPVITEAGAGTLAVVAASDMPTSTVVLGDSTDVVAAKYKFTATNESFRVDELTLVNNGGTDNTVATVRLSYTQTDGTTGEKEGYLSDHAVTFKNLDFYVTSSAYKTLTVYVDTNTVSDSTAVSGTTFQLDIDMAAGKMVAYGDSGLEVLSGGAYINSSSTSDISANDMTLRKTKPTLSLNASSPTTGMPGFDEVLRFNVAADSRGDVQLNSMAFKVTVTDKADEHWNYCSNDVSAPVLEDPDKFSVYNTDDLSTAIDADWDFYSTSGGACGDEVNLGYAEVTFAANEDITAGYTNTYILKVDTTDASSDDGDRVRFEIVDQNTANDTLGTDAISWDDSDTDVTADGSYIKNLPVTGGTISY